MYLIGKSVGRGHELRRGWLLARRQESQRVLDLFCFNDELDEILGINLLKMKTQICLSNKLKLG